MARDESPPPAYNERWDLEGDVSRNGVSQTAVSTSPARLVASPAVAPSRPAQLRPAPPQTASPPIPLRHIQKPSIASSHRSPAGSSINFPRGVRFKSPPGDLQDLAPETNPNAAGSALSRWRNKWRENKNRCLIWLLNLPLLVVFIMDIIGTHRMPDSAYYWNVVHSTPFRVIFILLSCLTSAINAVFILGARRRYQPEDCTKSKVMLWYLMAGFFISWPIIEIFGVQRTIYRKYTCQELGFRSDILLEVLGGVSGVGGMSQFPNNVTIRSDNEVFALSMSPTIQKWSDHNEFLLTPLSQTTTPSIFPRVANYEATIFLSERIHQFRRTAPGTNDTYVLVNGTFTDDPKYYLSFPTLSPPMHSTTKANWTYVDKRPWVELVNSRGTVLKTVEGQRGDKVNTMMRMCGAWAVTDMMEDLDKMEAVLVGLARMMIELMKWGLDY